MRQGSSRVAWLVRFSALSCTKGDRVTEWSQLQGFINRFAAQRGKGVSAAAADRPTAFAKDLIASKGCVRRLSLNPPRAG
jgi:hypothetical protein